ncbi:triose-phosphate isomerase [bacterium]|nr:triose-phosphate isomerase [bacterium]
MSSNPLVVANWKMNLSLAESRKLVVKLKSGLKNSAGCQIILCPSTNALTVMAGQIESTKSKPKFKLGAQNSAMSERGALTGEDSPFDIKKLGCSYVILGHSERRGKLGETDNIVNKKVKAALEAQLIPIVCVGESWEDRQNGNTDNHLIKQVTLALKNIKLARQKLIVAYEPVWAISTAGANARAVQPIEAVTAHQVINETLVDIFGEQVVEKNLKIIYGGSVNSENVRGFTGHSEIQGVLVGGASLDSKEFIQLVKNV